MKKRDPLFPIRMAVLVLAPCVLLLGCIYLYRFGSPVPCRFYLLTGLYCPGCGSGRAATAFLRGHFREAFGYNPMVFLLGIPAALTAFWEYLAFTLPGLVQKHVSVPQWLARTALWTILLFWILRNIPLFSFLAP